MFLNESAESFEGKEITEEFLRTQNGAWDDPEDYDPSEARRLGKEQEHDWDED